jgi:hypothetical protein
MRIVLEGCDCTGKTVFAKKLAEQIMNLYGVREVMHEHEGLPPDVPNLFEYYAIKALTYDFCIHDRLHLGERTYGLVYRNNDRLGAVGQHIIDHIIASEGFGVICTHPFVEVEKRWRKRIDREYVKDSEALRRIHAAYDDYADGKHWLIIDPFSEYDKTIIFDELKHLKENNKLIPYVWGIGPSTAETLVVGEMSNHPIYDLPFFSTTGSSAYLINTLMRLKIGHNYYLTNAFRKDGPPRIMKPIINELKKLKRVFALGQQATKILVQQGVPCLSLPHPQFYHRFKHHEAMEYLKLFKQAMEHNHAAQLRLL